MDSLQSSTSLTPFEGYDIEDNQSRGGSNFIKFNAALPKPWHSQEDGDGLKLDGRAAANLARVLYKWVDKNPIEKLFETPDGEFPDPAELNALINEKEWEKDQTAIVFRRGVSTMKFMLSIWKPGARRQFRTLPSVCG